MGMGVGQATTLFERGSFREELAQDEAPRCPTYLSKADNLGVLHRSCIHPQSLDLQMAARRFGNGFGYRSLWFDEGGCAELFPEIEPGWRDSNSDRK